MNFEDVREKIIKAIDRKGCDRYITEQYTLFPAFIMLPIGHESPPKYNEQLHTPMIMIFGNKTKQAFFYNYAELIAEK